MGLRDFTLYDFDTVEAHNLASQAYSVRDVGKLKITAIAKDMRALNPDVVITKRKKAFRAGCEHGDIVVCAVDSLAERRIIKEALRGDPFVVDGRMGGGQVEVWAQKASAWGIPEAAGDDPCAARYISYTSYIIAGMIANTVKRYLQGESVWGMVLLHTNTMEILQS